MEIFNYSTLFFIIILCALCLISYIIYYKRYRTISNVQSNSTNTTELIQPKKTETKKGKQNFKKPNQKKNKPPKKRKTSTADPENDSDTESYTLEEQLAQTIMSQQLTHDVINTTAVNAKPTVKRFEPPSSSKTKHGVIVKDSVFIRDEDWENVVSRKHKKKLYPVSHLEGEKTFSFTLDEEGGIVELQMCEICFPAESVTQPLDVTIEFENYKKFVDDTEEKVFLTPAVYFTVGDGFSCLGRKFTMKLNTKRMMGRGWDGNVCCQIETKDSDGTWISSGRTEYIFGKPVHIVTDELTSHRAVLTRGHNGAISRDLNIAAYIAKPRQQNPEFHIIHLCVYDKSDQSKYKMESNMQNLLVKMPPKTCNVTFGSDLQFRIKPTRKYSPDKKDVFMRWAEICKAFVNVKFQIRLTRNETDDPNFEADLRSVVYLEVLKVSPTATITQEEYFHFYWISANIFPKKRNKSRKQPLTEKGDEKIPKNDGFVSKFNHARPNLAKPVKNGQLDSTNQSAPIAMVTTENSSKTQGKRKKRMSQSSNIPTPPPFQPGAAKERHDKNATSPKDISLLKNHILTKKVQSTKRPEISTNQTSSQVKHGSNSSNQNGSARFEKLPQKVGKDAKNSQYFNNFSNKVQLNTFSQENLQNRSQKSSKTDSQDSSKISKTSNSKRSEDVASKPFRRIFRYRSPSKKRVKHEDSTLEVTKTKNEDKETFDASKDAEKKQFSSSSGPKMGSIPRSQSRNAKVANSSEKTRKGRKISETKTLNVKNPIETNVSGPKEISKTANNSRSQGRKETNLNGKAGNGRNSEDRKNSSSRPSLKDNASAVNSSGSKEVLKTVLRPPSRDVKNTNSDEKIVNTKRNFENRKVSSENTPSKPVLKYNASTMKAGGGKEQHQKKAQNRRIYTETHERARPMNHDTHILANAKSNERKLDSKQAVLKPSAKMKNDTHDRTQPKKVDACEQSQPVKDVRERTQKQDAYKGQPRIKNDKHERQQLIKNDTHERSQSVKEDTHERSRPIKQDSHQRPISSNSERKNSTKLTSPPNFNSNPKIKSATPNHLHDKDPPRRKPDEQLQKNDERNDDQLTGQHSPVTKSNHRMPRSPRYQRPYSQKQERGTKYERDGPREKLPRQKDSEEMKSTPVTNGEDGTMMPNGISNVTKSDNEAPKERRQRNPKNRKKGTGPQNNQVNHIESEVTP